MKPLLCSLTLLTVAVLGGCRGADPIWSAGCTVSTEPDSPRRLEWDTDGDGQADYEQICHPATGVVDALRYRSSDGTWEAAFHPREQTVPRRTLVVMIDGIPFGLLRECWDAGMFRLFHAPSPMVSVYPSMTDPAFGEMLCANPIPGYEAVRYDRAAGRVIGNATSYLNNVNEPWRETLVFRQTTIADALGYLAPTTVSIREIQRSYEEWQRTRPESATWYFASADAVAHMAGWAGTREYLRSVDRMLQRVYWQERGAIRIVLLSDHGNSFVPSQKIPLNAALAGAGLRETPRPDGAADAVAVPKLGLVNVLYVYGSPAALDRAERALSGCPGVEHWCRAAELGQPTQRVLVGDPKGRRAEILHRAGRYAYRPIRGDPLRYEPVLAELLRLGLLDSDGFASGDAWLTATAHHLYPDGPVRIVRGLTGLTANDADMLVSLRPGWYWGDGLIDIVAPLNGTHGGLSAADSLAFFCSTEQPGPAIFRQADLLTVINRQFRYVPEFRGIRCACVQAKLAAAERT